MFTYRCIRCGKQHNEARDYERAFQTRCLRCGNAFDVTAEMIHAVFTYRCIRCGKQHSDPRTLEQAARTGCLRCGKVFDVTADVMQAAGEKGVSPSRDFAITTGPGNGSSSRSEEKSSGWSKAKGQAITTQPSAKVVTAEAHADAEPPGSGLGESPETDPNGKAVKPKRTPIDPAALGDEAFERENERAGPTRNDFAEENDKPTPYKTISPMPWQPKKKEGKEEQPSIKKHWKLVVSILVPVLLIGGIGSYLVFGRSSKPEKKVTKATNASSAKPKTEPKKQEAKKEKPKAPTRVARVPAFRLSAARLATELAADREGTNRRYKDVHLQVSGVLDQFGILDDGRKPLPRFAIFKTERFRVACDWATLFGDDLYRQALRPGQPFTVLGTFQKDGFLHNCELLKPLPIPHEKYHGKTIELVGTVDDVMLPRAQEDKYPTVLLEGDTDTNLEIRCLFPRTSLEELKQLRPGVRVTIRGVCAGRLTERAISYVRLDNCGLVQTSGPGSATTRIEANEFAREFEEDIRPYYVPPRGKEKKVEKPLTIAQINVELKNDKKNVEKYLHQIVTVSGTLFRRNPPRELVLESRETSHDLKVSCRFARAIFEQLDDAREYRVSGFCVGLDNQGALRLENCEVDPSQLRSAKPRLTADFLPHRPGIVLTYDLAAYAPAGRTSAIVRQTWLQLADGVTETVTILSGPLIARSLFPPEKPENWMLNRRTKKIRLPGPVFEQRVTPTFVEGSQRIRLTGAGNQMVWEPVLKLGAKAGDSWQWISQGTKHVYTVTAIEPYRDRRSAIVQEMIVTPITENYPREVRHVYVEGLGEIERREWQRITSNEKKLVSEKKIVESENLLVQPRGPGQKKPDGKEK